MQVVILPSRTTGPKGGYGMYFYLGDGRGVKVLKGVFRSRKEAMQSSQMSFAKNEAEILKAAEKSKVTPKSYGVALVKRGHYWRVGIVMEHIGATRLADLGWPEHKILKVVERLEDRLYKIGVEHSDLHEWNVMVRPNGTRNKYFAIDFSPDYAYVMREAA